MKILKKSTLLLLSFVLVFMTSAAFFSVCAEDSVISSEGSGGTSITAETVIVTTPKFSISVPTGIPIGDIAKTETTSIKSAPFTVSVSNLSDLEGKQVRVRLSTPYNAFCMWSGNHSLAYEVFAQEQGGEPIAMNGTFYTFTDEGTVTGRVEVDQLDIPAEGTYGGILNFTFCVEDQAAQ